MKISKRILSLIFAVLMIVSSSAFFTQAAEKSVQNQIVSAQYGRGIFSPIYSMDNKTKTLYIGSTYTRKIKVFPSFAKAKSAKWSSSNKKVAVVNKNGKVTAKKRGVAVITAKIDGKKLSYKVKVINPTLSTSKTKLYVGTSCTLKVKGGTGAIKWASSNKKVATVSKKGVVKGIKKGTATISATRNGVKLTCKVTVVKSSIKIPKSKTEIAADYRRVINAAKKEKNFTLTHKSDMSFKFTDASTDLDDINNLIKGFTKPQETTYKFKNGQDSETQFTPNDVLPPIQGKCKLSKNGISSAVVSTSGSGYAVEITLVPEKQVFDGKTSSKAVHHESCLNILNMEALEMGSITVPEARFDYPNTKIKYTVGANGKISKLSVKLPINGSFKAVIESSGFEAYGKFEGRMNDMYTFKY